MNTLFHILLLVVKGDKKGCHNFLKTAYVKPRTRGCTG